ncbi:hypothetical protein RRG08_024926 [Elysia crispata]|uniref:Uncharacterized protein n=1 Tax=Elysia crispata TaxID=231223 RepID=A0AAE1A063_9GAST|nr:hypothetical protein RRG08_024926 [Elysia crispata]
MQRSELHLRPRDLPRAITHLSRCDLQLSALQLWPRELPRAITHLSSVHDSNSGPVISLEPYLICPDVTCSIQPSNCGPRDLPRAITHLSRFDMQRSWLQLWPRDLPRDIIHLSRCEMQRS